MTARAERKNALAARMSPVLAEHGVEQIAVPVDRPVEVAPVAADLQVGLVDIPARPRSEALPEPALAELIAHDRQQLRLPVAVGFVAHLDPTQRHDLAQVAQRQPVAEPAEHHEGNDVAGQAGPVQHAAAALVELPPAGTAAEPPLAASRHLPPLGHGRRPTAHAVHPEIPSAALTDDGTSASRRPPDPSLAQGLIEPGQTGSAFSRRDRRVGSTQMSHQPQAVHLSVSGMVPGLRGSSS